MNHAYRLVWNEAHRRYIPAPETAKGRGKHTGRSLRRSAAVMALGTSLLSLGALAGPTGGTVSAGSGSINQSGSATTITQASQNLAINWASFNVAASESVKFVQPNASAIALNRVLGTDASSINGSLSANGQVWILNPNGVLFGSTASVNVGGLVASTLSLSDADFLAGKHSFSGDGTQGNISNQGSLTGGYVALLGKQVSNTGTITTANGTAALAAGDKITLDFSGNQLLSVQVDEGTLNALVENKGLIRADNGTVILTASAKDALFDTVVNNEGVIEARGIDASGGTILLLGGFNGGTVKVGGTLDASASGGHAGGFIETSGAHVQVADGAKISTLSDTGKTGTWLIDPTDFTISSGSGAQTTSGMGATTLSNSLASSNISLTTDNSTGSDSGDINVNAAVTWSASTTLTLNAYNNIKVNAPITATGTSAGLALNYGGDYKVAAPITLSGASASLSLNGTAYALIHSMTQLDALDGASGHYALAEDLDATGTTYADAVISGAFSGTFTGLGHTISNLTISAPSTDYVGLFAQNSGTIRDLGLVGGSVSGHAEVGGLAGKNFGDISNAYATGSVSGSGNIGGLVGDNEGSISHAYATGSVAASGDTIGGLVGVNYFGSISNAYATGNVSGSGSNVGGLVGYNANSIDNAYASGSVSGQANVGGLVGVNAGGTISNAYWDSTTTGQSLAVGQDYGTLTNVSAVTSSTAYANGSYANLGTWTETASGSGVWVAADGSGNKLWVMVEGSTRPFLYSEYSTSIHNAHQLQLMAYDLGASYTLSANIDASETSGSNASGMWTSSGFAPVGNGAVAFSGSLDGQSHTIADLNISRSGTDYVGLFGNISSGGTISNLGLVGGSVVGGYRVGALAGENDGSISNAYATGNVSGSGLVGGLVGESYGVISSAYATGNVSATTDDYVGGLVGANMGTVSGAYATGNVSGVDSVGGLVGFSDGSISNSHASGSVSGSDRVGGVVGYNGGTIGGTTYASGNVVGNSYVGGLVGHNFGTGTISDAYATGSVSGTGNYVGGLVGLIDSGGTISDGYATGSVSGSGAFVGGLVGESDGSISNAYATGNVTGAGDNVGGLVGYNAGSISDAYATGSVSGTGNRIGALVGQNDNSISDAYATGSVSGSGNDLGGLVGANWGSISTAYATGSVSGAGGNVVGGLVGYNVGSITNAYATGSVSGSSFAGGLVGENYSGTISNAYATGNVSGTGDYVGGLVGANNFGSISNAYAAGSVSGSGYVGALVGYSNDGTVTASFWLNSISTAGFGNQSGSVDSYTRGLSASEASSAGTYTAAGWDVATVGGSSSVWRIYDGSGMPLLRSFLTALTVTTGNTSKTYDGTTSLSDSYTLSDSSADTSLILGTASYSTGSKNVGSYTVSTSGLYSGQQGYDISYVDGTANITAATLTVSGATAANKTYDGTTNAIVSGGSLSGLVSGDSVTLGQSGSFSNKNVGSGKTVTETFALSGSDAGNYVLATSSGTTTANITAATLTVSGSTAANKTYDGTTAATISGGTLSGVISGDSLTLGQSGTFSDKNAATGKTVSYTSSLSGTDAGNYVLASSTGTTTANITAATLTVSGSTAANKTYDGTSAASLSGGALSGLISGDTVSLSQSGTFSDKNAATGKTVSYTSSLSGTDAGNYVLASSTGTTTANITAAALTVTANNDSRIANGSAYSGGNGVSTSGLVGGDTSSVLSGSLVYGGTSQGATTAGSYSLTASGLSASNYVISYVNGTLVIRSATDSRVTDALSGLYRTSSSDTRKREAALFGIDSCGIRLAPSQPCNND